MRVFDFYLLKNLGITALFVSVTLAAIILLTQSLRFLELVINSGASSGVFWVLTMLALPRFLEIILPLSVMAAAFFVYNRMTMDSELVVARAAGSSPLSLGKPALMLAGVMTVFLWFVTLWLAPASLSEMQKMRQIVKAQFSSFIFQEGVFNSAGPGLTVYIRERIGDGEMRGLMIHDSREKNKNPSTTLAKSGVLVLEDGNYQVVVYDGSRQEYDPDTRTMSELNFERYIIDIPDSGPVRQRWQEPDERTIFGLLNPDMSNPRDIENLDEFHLEIHRRVVSPMLTIVFTLIALVALLPGPLSRRGQNWRMAGGIIAVIVIQGLYLGSFSIAKNNLWGLGLMYALVFLPLIACFVTLSEWGDAVRRKMFYRPPPLTSSPLSHEEAAS